MQTGGVRCWGEGFFAQLGYGTDVMNIGVDESPAEVYQQLGYSDVKIFGPVSSAQTD